MITVKGKDGVITKATKQEYGKYTCSNRCRIECTMNDPQNDGNPYQTSKKVFLDMRKKLPYKSVLHAACEHSPRREKSSKSREQQEIVFVVDKNDEHNREEESVELYSY
jgi:hypothetical protein